MWPNSSDPARQAAAAHSGSLQRRSPSIWSSGKGFDLLQDALNSTYRAYRVDPHYGTKRLHINLRAADPLLRKPIQIDSVLLKGVDRRLESIDVYSILVLAEDDLGLARDERLMVDKLRQVGHRADHDGNLVAKCLAKTALERSLDVDCHLRRFDHKVAARSIGKNVREAK